jgi:taurine dioxygenase
MQEFSALLNCSPLAGPFGLEVHGIDATRAQPPAVVEELRRLVAEHCCLVLPGQDLSEEQHVAFVGLFGETVVPWLHAVELNTLARMKELPGRPGYTGKVPGVVYFMNGPEYRDEPEDNYLQGWHADMTHVQVSLPLVFLHCLAAPEYGYETWISNQYSGYEALDAETRALAEGLRVAHSFRHIFPNLPPVLHPVIQKHPLSGRRAIFGLPGSAEAVPVGLSSEAAKDLMAKLTAHLADERCIYRHRWRAGDVLVWDNRCALHRRGPQVKGQTRILRRCMASDGHAERLRAGLMGGA